jgi:N,N'-diacetylchitobiose transport system substrate-binding protein
MKKKFVSIAALAATTALALSACAGGGSSASSSSAAPATDKSANAGKSITLWLAGGDTSDELREYLKTTFNEKTGATLKIEEQAWGDLVAKATTAMSNADTTPDVVEVGNTQSPTFTYAGAFADISDMYDELGGDKLLQSFVEVGSVDGKKYTLPYYFGSRYAFYRKDVWKEAGITEVPKTLDEFNSTVKTIAEKNPRDIKDFSGFFLGGQDWRDGISWIFANGGDLAKKEGDQWVSTLSDENSLKGLAQLQDLYKNASNAPNDAKDSNQYIFLNDSDAVVDAAGEVTSKTKLNAATIMAPGWAHWSIGDLKKVDGKDTRVWNDDVFGTFVLPGNDGKPAPVFAGGSNIGVSAKSKEPGLARELMKIIFSSDYQKKLGGAGLGPANSDYVSSLGDDQFAKALIESASNSKLTPAAPGWATVEANSVMEEFFSKIRDASDLAALAKEYDDKITPMLNAQ